MASRPRPANRSRLKPDTDAAVAEIRAVYAEVDRRPVERFCERRTECCQFRLTGRTPLVTKGEAVVAARAFRATGRTKLPEKADGSCPFLDPVGKCLIYEARPFGCRTHFCAAAGGPYSRKEVLDLIRRLEDVDHALGGDGSYPLKSAVERVL